MRRLEIVHIYAPCEQDCRSDKNRKIADVLPFFNLPHVKELSLTVQVPVTISWPVPCPPSSLNPCDLLVGNLRESSLSKILSVTNQLEYLQWIWGYHFKSDGQVHTPVIDLDEVSEVLSYARKSLLTVDIVVAPKPKKEQVLPLALSSTKD